MERDARCAGTSLRADVPAEHGVYAEQAPVPPDSAAADPGRCSGATGCKATAAEAETVEPGRGVQAHMQQGAEVRLDACCKWGFQIGL